MIEKNEKFRHCEGIKKDQCEESIIKFKNIMKQSKEKKHNCVCPHGCVCMCVYYTSQPVGLQQLLAPMSIRPRLQQSPTGLHHAHTLMRTHRIRLQAVCVCVWVCDAFLVFSPFWSLNVIQNLAFHLMFFSSSFCFSPPFLVPFLHLIFNISSFSLFQVSLSLNSHSVISFPHRKLCFPQRFSYAHFEVLAKVNGNGKISGSPKSFTLAWGGFGIVFKEALMHKMGVGNTFGE